MVWFSGWKGSYDILIAGFVSFREGAISCFRYHDDSRGRFFSRSGGAHELEVGQCYGVCGPKVSRLIFVLDGVDLAVFSFVFFF